MFCEKCGKEVKEGKAFCTECGAPVKQMPAAAPGQPAPPPPAAQPIPPAAAPGLPGVAAPVPQKKKRTGLVVGIVVTAVVIITAVLLVVLLAFSSDTGQAKSLINKAAPIMKGLTVKGTKLGNDLGSLLENIAKIPTAAAYEPEANNIRAQVKEINKEEDQSATYISQVQKLSGVADYKEYASVIADLIRTDKKTMIQITDYLDYLSKQSFPINIETIRDTTSQFGAKVQQLSAEGEDLKNKAQKIKTDKNL